MTEDKEFRGFRKPGDPLEITQPISSSVEAVVPGIGTFIRAPANLEAFGIAPRERFEIRRHIKYDNPRTCDGCKRDGLVGEWHVENKQMTMIVQECIACKLFWWRGR